MINQSFSKRGLTISINTLENVVIYIVTVKELFLKEAKISAKSIRKYNKNIGISIFFDEKNKFDNNEKIF